MNGEEGAASAALSINARRARPAWKSLSADEKLDRLEADLWAAEKRIAAVEGEVLDAQSRQRLLFRDLGKTRRRLNSLMPRNGDGPSTLVLDYAGNGEEVPSE